ncbi:MAG TPA: EAL domain-containing protein, partial [Acidimicrobiia bacterium]|nr:EAL domain-containing protein [Acidimicrobiia bacterium]
MAGVTRLAAALPAVAAVAVLVTALISIGAGLRRHLRQHSTPWRHAWFAIAAALALMAANTLALACTAKSGTAPMSAISAWAGVAGGMLVCFGLVRLIAVHAAGRALDALLEGVIVAAACNYVAWAWMTAQGFDHLRTALALIPVAVWVVAVWLVGRLAFVTAQPVAAYRYLGAAFVAVLFIHAIQVGTRLDGSGAPPVSLIGLTLCAYLLWGASALHTSLDRTFAPVDAAPRRFGVAQLAANLTVAIVAPTSLLLLPTTRESPGVTALVAASALLPLLLVVYLIRQIRGRARAEHRARHDVLTGLPNRSLLADRAATAFAQAQRESSKVAVMFLDLDRFKVINDTLGHTIGNQLLQAIGERLRSTVRDSDTIARLGGDEFTVVVSDVRHQDDVVHVARRISEAFAAPFVIADRELHTRSSIGIAMYPDDGTDIETLLKHADIAMYRAKASSRDGFEFYTSGFSLRVETTLAVESGLRNALAAGGLELHYQPQIDLTSGNIVGLEALARWSHAKLGMIPPGVFVPVAEESELVVALGEWALDEACAQARRWIDAGIAPRPLAVNISVRQLQQEGVVEFVAGTLARHGIDATNLELEITESIFMRDLERASAALAALRDLGVRCSIDDFGTGFSGLSYLADLSIDRLKIDRSFVSRVKHAHTPAPVIDAILGLGRGLDLDIVAEGVETPEQAQFLVEHGCTKMQGYLFSPPQSVPHITQLLTGDDAGTIDWQALSLGITNSRDLAPTAAPSTPAAQLLAAICGPLDGTRDLTETDVLAVLEALAPAVSSSQPASTLRRTAARVAAGTVVGILPLTGGLAAAQALPAPAQNVVATTARTLGIDLPLAPSLPGAGLP